MKAWPQLGREWWQRWQWTFTLACLLLCLSVFLEKPPTDQTERPAVTLHLMCLFSCNPWAPWHLAHGGQAADTGLVMDAPRPLSASVLERWASSDLSGLGLLWVTAIQLSPCSHRTLLPGPPAGTELYRCSSPYTIKPCTQLSVPASSATMETEGQQGAAWHQNIFPRLYLWNFNTN